MITEILILLFLIGINGLFAMGEMAILSARKSRLTHMTENGDRGAKLALFLSANPTRFLSTIQTGITIVNVLTGMYGGLALASRMSDWLREVPTVAKFADSLGLAIAVALVSFVSLIFGELVPKRIAIGNPEKLSSSLSRFMWLVQKVCSPAVWFLSHNTQFVLRLLRIPINAPSPITDQEIRILMREGTATGQFEEGEQTIVMMALKLGDRRASTLMTPRTQMSVIDLADSAAEIKARLSSNQRARYPVVEGDLSHIVGVLEIRDLVSRGMSGKVEDIRQLMKPPLFLPDTAPALKLFEAFKNTGQQMAIIVDEYGDIEGLVTQNDLLEALVGDIAEANGEQDIAAVKRADGSWLIDGMMPLDELSDHIGTNDLNFDEVDEVGVNTVGGFVMASLKRIPRQGDQFEQAGVSFEVVKMHGRRVDQVLVTVKKDGD
ncbi:MAG: hemolysin family protein [Candidatus Pacebacteria bacterium]|nr:hemolysin family protein [Candidatus Paceibacterota bacterium]